MQKTKMQKLLSLLVCAVLIAATALFTTSCNNSAPPENGTSTTEAAAQAQAKVMGQGATKFFFTVVDGEGNETAFEINTDKTKVGEALQELGLIQGDEGAYGLYVKTVKGITADYDTTGTYWAFYINGEMAPSGVDMTDITAGASYSFVVSK